MERSCHTSIARSMPVETISRIRCRIITTPRGDALRSLRCRKSTAPGLGSTSIYPEERTMNRARDHENSVPLVYWDATVWHLSCIHGRIRGDAASVRQQYADVAILHTFIVIGSFTITSSKTDIVLKQKLRSAVSPPYDCDSRCRPH